jgi:hypothetical protein
VTILGRLTLPRVRSTSALGHQQCEQRLDDITGPFMDDFHRSIIAAALSSSDR